MTENKTQTYPKRTKTSQNNWNWAKIAHDLTNNELNWSKTTKIEPKWTKLIQSNN